MFIHTHVREDALQLFGFADTLERDLFRELLKVSGIGPKMALGILSGISAADLMKAIQQKDGTRLQKIPGIGKKTADRLHIELADRLKNLSGAAAVMNGKGSFDLPKESELESVLLNLGYQRQEVQRAVEQARKNSAEFDQWPLETMVKTTLKELMQGKPV
jgi:Holliday junction DNA helicase RuvA